MDSLSVPLASAVAEKLNKFLRICHQLPKEFLPLQEESLNFLNNALDVSCEKHEKTHNT